MDDLDKKETRPEEEAPYTPHSTKTRIIALVCAIGVALLSILYAYSIATGGIFAW